MKKMNETNGMILLASHSPERLHHWQNGLEGLVATSAVGSMDALKQDLVRSTPVVLLLDLDFLGAEGATSIAELLQLNPTARIIVLSAETSDAKELDLFRAGVCGCCHSDIDLKQLLRVVAAVMHGELWIRRTITPHLLSKAAPGAHGNREIRRSAVRFTELTPREREIAELVGKGLCNKQIARNLTIAESTVKAHLTDIFRKLGACDRLKLALLVNDMSEA